MLHLPGVAAALQADAGKLVMAGAVGETPEGAVFVFKDISKEVGHSHGC